MKPDVLPAVKAALSSLPDVAEFGGLPDAWHWTTSGGRFHFVLALCADGRHALQINIREHFDEELVRATLAFALQREADILAAQSFVVLPGFNSPGRGFEVVAALAPPLHEFHKAEHPQLHAMTYRVYPAYRCEFSGRETPKEALLRTAKMIEPANLKRAPRPLVRLRYSNTRTRGRSLGDKRGVANPSVLFTEISKLENASGSFVEFENYLGQVATVTWAIDFLVQSEGRKRDMNKDEVRAWAERFILYGLESADAPGP